MSKYSPRSRIAREQEKSLGSDFVGQIAEAIKLSVSENFAQMKSEQEEALRSLKSSLETNDQIARLKHLEEMFGSMNVRMARLEADMEILRRQMAGASGATVVSGRLVETETVSSLSAEIAEDPETPDTRLRCFGIIDSFTRSCLIPEVKLDASHGPDDWQEVISRRKPDFAFVESAWNANMGRWQYRIAAYQKKFHDSVGDLLDYAGKNDIPTVFWNKEDPFHFERFLHNAKRFDLVVTTDESCVERYKKAGIKGKVIALPFAAQPALHNPILTSARSHEVAFAGSYYADRHDERRADMEIVLDPAREFGLHIYDRGGDPIAKPTDVVKWPEKFQPHVAGNLPYDLVVQAYRRYKVFMNVNSIKRSKTMFSRRVLELLACGTPVISSPSDGISHLFSDVVLISTNQEETKAHLERLLYDEHEWARLSALGVRRVMSKHTYAHMLSAIYSEIGVEQTVETPKLILLMKLSASQNVERVCNTLAAQTRKPDRVILVTDMSEATNAIRRAAGANCSVEIFSWDAGANAPVITRAAKQESGYVAFMTDESTYGDAYLEDVVNAFSYWGGAYVGKHVHFDGGAIKNSGFENTIVTGVVASSLSVRTSRLDTGIVRQVMNRKWFKTDEEILALHRFSFNSEVVDRSHIAFVI